MRCARGNGSFAALRQLRGCEEMRTPCPAISSHALRMTERAAVFVVVGQLQDDGVHGSVNATIVPAPGVLSAHTRPPCARTSCFTIERPRPAPPVARARDGSTR